MYPQPEPLALGLYRRFRTGESLEQLATELAIPIERMKQRLDAAEAYWERCEQADPASPFVAGLALLCGRVRKAA